MGGCLLTSEHCYIQLALSWSVVLSKLIELSVSQFLHLWNGDNIYLSASQRCYAVYLIKCFHICFEDVRNCKYHLTVHSHTRCAFTFPFFCCFTCTIVSKFKVMLPTACVIQPHNTRIIENTTCEKGGLNYTWCGNHDLEYLSCRCIQLLNHNTVEGFQQLRTMQSHS